MIGKFPKQIEDEIEEMAKGIPLSKLAKHFQLYSQGYREGKNSHLSLPSPMEKLCYLATRLPATFGATMAVLSELKRRVGGCLSLLDLGSGPGTTLLAANALGWELSATLFEKNREFIALGKKFLPFSVLWKNGDLLKEEMLPLNDLVTFSYSLGEIPQEHLKKVLTMAWEATQKALIIVEPGTSRAFENLLVAREYLINLGGHIIAPCPHSMQCPMSKNDWCHFSVRVERTSLHRKIKGAQLGFEDEKFCYLIVAKEHISPCKARIIRSPQKKSGHTSLTICTQHEIKQKIISKRDGEIFRSAKKLNWGDEI